MGPFRALPWVRQKQIAAIAVVAALALVGSVHTVAKGVGDGPGSSGSVSSGTTPLGCTAQPGTIVYEDTCAGRQVMRRLCGFTTDDVSQTGIRSATTTLVARDFGSGGTPLGSLQFNFSESGVFDHVKAYCLITRRPGVVNAHISAAMWMTMTSPGSSDLLPVELR
ncbi:hypothetical protein [Pseudonocardia sp. ICBG1034]|uniref:hypothetical protein n=1 Tax=Pseudonocardia sp. ICBG1034 TaxID=2844381 RepID=UPI001CCE7A30|nr:hypothetical protein [Pseudonocardia sp. ICBG1034]